MTISTEAIKSALSALIDPVTGTDYVSGKMFKSAETDENGNVKVFIELGYPAKHRAEYVSYPGAVSKANVGISNDKERLCGWARPPPELRSR